MLDKSPSPSTSPVVELGSFVAATAELGEVWLWGSHVAYTPAFRSAVICDLETGKARTLGRQVSGRGQLSSIRGQGDTVIWIDFDGAVDSALGGSPWTIYAHDLKTGDTRSIATGRPKGNFFTIPAPELEWPYLVWTDLPQSSDIATAGPQIVVYDFRDGSRRVLASGNFPDNPSVDGGLVYFEAKTAETRDLYVVPADGSAKPRAITKEHKDVITELRARNGWVTYTLHPKQSDQAIGDLPVMALRAGSTTPMNIGLGHDPEPGSEFAVFIADTFKAVRLDKTADEIVVVPEGIDFASRWSVDGKRLAFVTVDDPGGRRLPAYLRIVQLN